MENSTLLKKIIFSLFASLIILFATVIYNAQITQYYIGPESDHFDGKHFFNPGKPLTTNFFKLLQWKFTSNRIPWPEHVANEYQTQPEMSVYDEKLTVTAVGHATVLVQTQGVNILTDPIWSERASPVPWLGPKRIREPGVAFDDLPPIDVVVISHNHYDHLDLPTLARLWERDQPRIIVPLGNDTIIRSYDKNIAAEGYDWGDSVIITDQVSIHLLPTHHWSARHIYDRNKALWSAYVIETPGGNIYFPGDTGYGEGDYFRLARECFGPFRLALLPIGAYEPRWFMKYSHIDPEEAVKAYLDLEAKHSMVIHFQTFDLGDDAFGKAVDELHTALEQYKVNKEQFFIPAVGQTWQVPILE